MPYQKKTVILDGVTVQATLQTEILLRMMGPEKLTKFMVDYNNARKSSISDKKQYTDEDYELVDSWERGEISTERLKAIWKIKFEESFYRRIGKMKSLKLQR